MNFTKSFTKKLKRTQSATECIHVDIDDGSMVKGWAASSADRSASVLVEVSSKSHSISLLADQYRSDVRREGLHGTGFCGFQLDVSSWKDKDISVSFLNVVSKIQSSGLSPFFFIHIPKTAGTSFKRAAEKYFGIDGVVRNYGVKSPETTAWVKSVVLDNKNYPDLYRRISSEGVGLYTGHLVALPTANVFPIKNIVTFLRHPQEQILSHYHHYARWHGYYKTIEDFINNPGFKNLQSRHLKGLPLQLIGFVGLTERYAESINMYNAYSGFNLEIREDNKNSHNTPDKITEEICRLIAEHNIEDIALYEQATSLLSERFLLSALNKDWCFSFIDRLNEKMVAGVAYMQSNDQPVRLVIKNNGAVIGNCVANKIRPGLVQFGVPNKGFIGFSFPLPKHVTSSEISIEVESTGQVLQLKF